MSCLDRWRFQFVGFHSKGLVVEPKEVARKHLDSVSGSTYISPVPQMYWVWLMSSLRDFAYSEIRDFVHRDAHVFSISDTASRVLGQYSKSGRYESIVRDDGKTGIVTVRDMLNVDQPELTKVGRIWEKTGSFSPSDRVLEAAEFISRANYRALPVVEGESVLGLISQVDLSEGLCGVRELSKTPAVQVMRQPVISLEVDSKVTAARRLMLDHRISHIPITRGSKLVGIVTAKIIVDTFIVPTERTTLGERAGEKVRRFPGSVTDIMDKTSLTLPPNSSLLDVAQGMRDKAKSAALIVDETGSILGITTPREVILPLLGLVPQPELPIYIIGLAREDFFERAVAEDKVRRTVSRSLKMHPHIEEVSIRIERIKEPGQRTRFTVNGRVYAPGEAYNAKAEGWDIMDVFDRLCERLDRVLSGAKHERVKRTRRTASERKTRYPPRAPPWSSEHA